MPTSYNFDKFSSETQVVLLKSQELAEGRSRGIIGTEHLLLGLLALPTRSIAREVLREYMIDVDQIELVLSLEAISEGRSSRDGLTDEARRVLEQSALQAIHSKAASVEPTHILWAIVSDPTATAHTILAKTGVQPEHLRSQLEQLFHEHLHLDQMVADHLELFDLGDDEPHPALAPMQTASNPKRRSMIETLTTDLTALAKADELDPMIGRTDELNRLMHILLRRTKNNPVLVGEPGVGKTSIIEGFAHRLAEGTVPKALADLKLRRLEVATLVAGTMYRGQFEDRMRKLLNEIEERGDIILFIDEVHTVIGAGSAEGSLDAANILKPALTKGKLRLIGATTLDEYQKHVEKDAAFERRFQPLMVREPSNDETVLILKGLRKKLEAHHRISIPDVLIEEAVTLAARYLPGRRFPDKAIDVIDEAAASFHLKEIEQTPKGATVIQALERQLKTVAREKAYELKKQNVERAAFLRDIELKLKLKLARSRQASVISSIQLLTKESVLTTVSRMSGIPLKQLTHETLSVQELSSRLESSIVGQTEAVTRVARALARSRVGLRPITKPRSALLFVGPSGVGKTALAYTMSRELFGDDSALIRLDMSEYREPHTVSRLIGAPPGYVGHEDAGRLTERVRQQPASIILFDEVEKAHPDIFNTLLQILDYGTLTDSKGRAVNFRSAHIVLTTNIGSDVWQSNPPGFGTANQAPDRAQAAAKSLFRAELLNRLDDIIVFSPLSKNTLGELLDRRIATINEQLAVHRLVVTLQAEARRELVRIALLSALGARELERLVANHVEPAVIDLLSTKRRSAHRAELTHRQGAFQLVRAQTKTKATPTPIHV